MTTNRAASSLCVREAQEWDLTAIREIYNQGIEDRVATLDEDPKSETEIRDWYDQHDGPYAVVVAERDERVVGWASLSPYLHRCAYRGIADLSVYVDRSARCTGVGTALIRTLEAHARRADFRKIVLFALARNEAGARLYAKLGYREVGVFKDQGRLDGRLVDVTAKEKLLKPLVLLVCKHNSGRSQMAEAFLRHFAGDAVDVASAGTIAADRPDPVL